MVDAELYRQLDRLRRAEDSFGDVIRRLMIRGAPRTKKGRPVEEILALARVARREWERRLATGRVKVVERA